MCKPPKAKKPRGEPPETIEPIVELGTENPAADLRRRRRRGRSQLRTGLSIGSPSGSGLTA